MDSERLYQTCQEFKTNLKELGADLDKSVGGRPKSATSEEMS